MVPAGVEIAAYRPEWEEAVLGLLAPLWGGATSERAAYFRWKYESSPREGLPVGFVALAGGRPVAFRAYFAQALSLPGDGDRLVLAPGDTVVDPAYRGQGLSVAMGRRAESALAPGAPCLLNLSATRASLPGYRALGFVPLAPRYPVVRAGPAATLRYLLAVLRGSSVATAETPATPGVDGAGIGLEVAGVPPCADLAALAGRDRRRQGRLALRRDVSDLSWRFANPRGRYRFYLLRRGGELAAYCAIGRSAEGRRGHLLDYAAADAGALRELVGGIARRREFDVLSIPRYAADDRAGSALAALGFRDRHPIRALERWRAGEVPVLVRPTSAEAGAGLGGLDLREPASWALTPIASDAL